MNLINKLKHVNGFKGQNKEIENLHRQQHEIREKLLNAITLQLASLPTFNPAPNMQAFQKSIKAALATEMEHQSLEFLQTLFESLEQRNGLVDENHIILSTNHIKTFSNGLKVGSIQNTEKNLYNQNRYDQTKIFLKQINTIIPQFKNDTTAKTTTFTGFAHKDYYVLTNMTNNILAITPITSPFIHNGAARMIDTSYLQHYGFTGANAFKINPVISMPTFGKYSTHKDHNCEVLFDAKQGTLTKLGSAKVLDMLVSKDGQKSSYIIVRPQIAVVRHYISLENGQYCTTPQIFVAENNQRTLDKNTPKQRLERKVNYRTSTTADLVEDVAYMPEKLCTRHVPAEKFLEINDGEIRLKCPQDKFLTNNSVIIKTPQGKYVARYDYPQAIITEEYYSSTGELLNQNFFDYDGNRLLAKSFVQHKLSDFTCEK